MIFSLDQPQFIWFLATSRFLMSNTNILMMSRGKNDTKKLRHQTIIFVTPYHARSKKYYVVVLFVTKLSWFQFFVTIFAHSATPINEVHLEPLWPICGHGANKTSQLALPHWFKACYTRSRSVETWGNSIIFLFQFCDFPILLNLMRKTGCIRAK